MSEDDLVKNSDEVNMKIYKIAHPEVPGYLSAAAQTDDDADAIFHDWFHARFGRPPTKFMVEDVSRSLLLATQLHRAANGSKRPGVAYAVEKHGWIVLPPDIEAPGPYRLSAHPVECYKFAKAVDERGVHIFAETAGDAWQIYHVWIKEHGRQEADDNHVKAWPPEDEIQYDPHLTRAANFGVTGVVSMRLSGWDILPPWDIAAGDS